MYSQIYNECTKVIENAKETALEVEELKKNEEMYIYNFFEDIKRQVDIRREDLKFKIDNYSDEIIKLVELNQTNCIKLSKEVNQITENIEKSRKDLSELISRFDSLKFNDKNFENIKANVEVVNQEFQKMLNEYKNFLVGNKKYTFEFKELPIEEIFGQITEFQVNFLLVCFFLFV